MYKATGKLIGKVVICGRGGMLFGEDYPYQDGFGDGVLLKLIDNYDIKEWFKSNLYVYMVYLLF